MIVRMSRTCMLAAVLAVAAAGCGGGQSAGTADSAGPEAKDALEDLKALLTDAGQTGKRPPANANDMMQQFDATNPAASNGLMRGLIVYAWGAKLTGGSAVVAHDAKAETDGGYVLLQDGTIKVMTADEFKAAPKAKK
jgi:hypothetical protein